MLGKECGLGFVVHRCLLASSTLTAADQFYYLQQLEALDAQKASLISHLLTNQFDPMD